ncbi:hypothetical protein [Pollutibacter soli]|uniref:glycoside hydrolase family 130 protein n=1 Tax=Pollutibacter soli TaxID=3034157 RepID=UPI00301348FA
MVEVRKEGVLLEKTDIEFESEAVLNPAVIQNGEGIHVFYRAVAPGNYSTIGYCRLKNPLEVEYRMTVPLISREFGYESHGVEDPRIVKIDGLYYLTYTAYDGVNAMGALAVSKDLKHFDKLGLIVPEMDFDMFSRLTSSHEAINDKYLRYNIHGGIHKEEGKKVLVWDKNLIFFPRRINGNLFFLHRIRPDIQIVEVNELEDLTQKFWEEYFLNLAGNILISPKYEHEVSYLGGGCPPIETASGWLVIYHGVHDTIRGYVYSACASLLDLKNPRKEIARLPYPLFTPEYDWELEGEVNNVCFPTGAVVSEDTLYIYYGAADEQIACASLSISDLIHELKQNLKDD